MHAHDAPYIVSVAVGLGLAFRMLRTSGFVDEILTEEYPQKHI